MSKKAQLQEALDIAEARIRDLEISERALQVKIQEVAKLAEAQKEHIASVIAEHRDLKQRNAWLEERVVGLWDHLTKLQAPIHREAASELKDDIKRMTSRRYRELQSETR